MGKLQKIKRSNGSVVYLAYIPKDIIEESKLEKGDDLDFAPVGNKRVMIIGSH